MRVEERIMSILLAEKIKENPEHAKKVGIEIINKENQQNESIKAH